jgi:hypothetical protein
MRSFRSFAFLAVVVLPLVALTACHRAHPAAANEDEPRAAAPSSVVALNPRAPTTAANPSEAPPAKDKSDKIDIHNLHVEVLALETIAQLKLTRPQLEQLAKLAPTTAGKAKPSQPVQVSAEYQRTLRELCDALADNNNEVRIAELSDKLDELRDKEEPEFAEVELTAAARRHVPELLQTLSARQVMGFLKDFADEFPDPRDKLEDACEEIRQLEDKEAEELRDEVAGQVGWLTAGLDAAAASKVRQRALELLNRVRKMKDEEYKSKEAERRRQIDGIVGKVGPTDVIRHFTERSLAELLSNPRLSAAATARLQKEERTRSGTNLQTQQRQIVGLGIGTEEGAGQAIDKFLYR